MLSRHAVARLRQRRGGGLGVLSVVVETIGKLPRWRWTPRCRISLLSLPLVWLGHTACAPGVFACEEDSHCSGANATCQPSGYCSFPDLGCASGQRYGEHAPADYAKRCVDEQEPDASSSAGPAVDDSATSSGETSGSASATTTAPVDASSTGSDGSPSTSSSPISMDGSTSGDSSSSVGEGSDGSTSGNTTATSTGGEELHCVIEDEFDDGVINGPWSVFGSQPVTESDGSLTIGISSTGFGYSGVASAIGSFSEMFVETEITLAPPQGQGAVQQMLNLDSLITDDSLTIAVEGSNLFSRQTIGGTLQNTSIQPFNPVEHRFLRLRESGGQMFFEHSADAISWTVFRQAPVPIDLSSVQIGLVGGTYTTLGSSHTIGFGRARVCLP